MLKLGLFLLGVIVSIFLLSIYWSIFVPKKTATSERMLEVLNEGFENKETLDNTRIYEMIDLLNIHKSEILDSLSKEGKPDCVNLSLNYYEPKYSHLPKKLFVVCTQIASELKQDCFVRICCNEPIELNMRHTDRRNYLYVDYKFHIGDSLKRHKPSYYFKERMIKGRYQYSVSVTDAFNDIDPDKVVPN